MDVLSAAKQEKKYPDKYAEKQMPIADRRYRIIACTTLGLLLICLSWTTGWESRHFHDYFWSKKSESLSHTLATTSQKQLVPLEAHVMSKCPDAKECLEMMVIPTMEQVWDKVNFTLSFIGTPTANDGVDCMHGPGECMGNIIELCAAHLYPKPIIYLGFTMCLSREYQEIPQQRLVEDCALEHGIDFNKIHKCAISENGGFAIGMLRDSVRRTAQAGVTKSCTVRLNNEIYCIRDGHKWKDCPYGTAVDDLVTAVVDLYKSLQS
ncbi:Bgt-1277 [Blumeria graminis f. sp. tritici]|uniref:Bgt-1277 n=2 Tax=Blumeria graminis f. sp. tritici TaxID=62690 RepID=A0A061HIZ3_BLUGR|nr:hypothetical protein BGT96224_1277 [Blumeria graminis f. sp. tritici 96224]VCU39272.1 Bgt-1277 [Blumeria graminis f. sp. tritici]